MENSWHDGNLNQKLFPQIKKLTFAGLTVTGQINAWDTVNGILFGVMVEFGEIIALQINDSSSISLE